VGGVLFPHHQVVVPPEWEGLRVDVVLTRLLGLSRASLQRYVEEGLVHVNGQPCKKRLLVATGDLVSISLPPPPPSHVTPQEMNFDILYEDAELFIINKPAGLVVHPAPGNRSGTFVNGFVAYCADLQCDDPIRPGLVHRLDKDTSGVLIAAKKPDVVAALSGQFQDRTVRKEYLAIGVGRLEQPVCVDKPIGRDPVHRQRMAVLAGGKPATTQFVPEGPPFRLARGRGCIQSAKDCTLIRAIPHTGRTHQIRVHLASLGVPILGDSVYGHRSVNEMWNGLRQMLHCRLIAFTHPRTGKDMVVQAPIPEDMKEFLQKKDNSNGFCP
jgi:23S rRNA pseudouridine1911/1915/1917 synthase